MQVVALLMFLALKRRVRNIGPMKKLFQNERHRDVYLMSFAKQNFAQIFGNFLGYLKYIGFFLKKTAVFGQLSKILGNFLFQHLIALSLDLKLLLAAFI